VVVLVVARTPQLSTCLVAVVAVVV